MIRTLSIWRLWRILPFLFKLLIAVGTPWLPWLVAKSRSSLPLSSHYSLLCNYLLFYKDSHHLDLVPTWVIEDNLILRFLIRSAKTISPNQVTFFVEVTIQPTTGTICLRNRILVVIYQGTFCFCNEQYGDYMNHGHLFFLEFLLDFK